MSREDDEIPGFSRGRTIEIPSDGGPKVRVFRVTPGARVTVRTPEQMASLLRSCSLPPGHSGSCVRGYVADGVPLCDREVP